MYNKPDEELLSLARTGDTEAFRHLVLRYESKVAGVVTAMLGNTVEADDVGQEVFIRFYHALAQFKGEAGLGTYLSRIAINLSLNELKKRKKTRLFFSRIEENIPEIETQGQKMPTEHLEELLDFCLQQLDTPFRSVIILRLVEGYSTQETADILQLPLGTVLSRLSRGQQKLKEMLKKHL